MDPGHKRIRVVVGDHELELEGDDAFIAEHAESLQGLLDALRTTPISPAGGGDGKKGPKITPLSGVSESEFGEQLLSMPKSASQTDQMLLAGLFAQRSSADATFVTKDASGLLLEQSIKVGNPSQCMTNNLQAKRVFKVGQAYRVSKQGEEYLATLLVN